VPREVTARWAEFINPYLENRESLALCVALVDVTVPPQELDLQLLDWLRHVDRSFLLVATKADRISGNQLRTSLHKLSERLSVMPDQIIPFSAKAPIGRDELWRAIKAAAGVQDAETRNIAKTGS
jgi:GTP-binding protein